MIKKLIAKFRLRSHRYNICIVNDSELSWIHCQQTVSIFPPETVNSLCWFKRLDEKNSLICV